MSAATDRILDRIRRLLALAQSPNVHEAASAAAEAQRLMLEHQVSDAVLEDGPAPVIKESIQGDTGKRRAVIWHAMLADCIARRMNVRVVYVSGTERIDAIGRGPDVAATAVLYHHLKSQLERACDAAWYSTPHAHRSYLTATSGGKVRYTDTFMRGARDEVGKRMDAQRESVADAQAEQARLAGSIDPAGCALVRASALVKMETYAAEAQTAVKRWMDDAGYKTRATSRTVRSAGTDAYEAGQAAGRRASLTANARSLPGRR